MGLETLVRTLSHLVNYRASSMLLYIKCILNLLAHRSGDLRHTGVVFSTVGSGYRTHMSPCIYILLFVRIIRTSILWMVCKCLHPRKRMEIRFRDSLN